MSAVDVVQRQLEAYNARALDRFLAAYSDTVQVFRPPSLAPTLSGKSQLADFYASQRFNLPALKTDLVNRMVVGNCIIRLLSEPI
jgi:hypothetical protein